jgi:hypothetical protein
MSAACGNCFFGRRDADLTSVVCAGVPPTAYAAQRGVLCVRPRLVLAEPACALWRCQICNDPLFDKVSCNVLHDRCPKRTIGICPQ